MGRFQLSDEFRGLRPHVPDLLKDAGFPSGGSPRGWSALSTFAKCQRMAYYSFVEGLRPKRPSDGLDVGTLLHACLEMHYKTGGVETWGPLEALKNEVPTVVDEVRRLLTVYFKRYAHEESQTWDVRAVEFDASGIIQGRPTEGKFKGRAVKTVATTRFDLVVARRERGAPTSPAGPVPQGVYVIDHKAFRSLTRDVIRGYGMDGQLLTMALLWRLGKLDEVFGKLNGFIMNIVVKTKEPQLQRIESVVDDTDIDRFSPFLSQAALNFYSKLAEAENGRRDPKNWPMQFTSCKGQYGLCQFWDLCESRGQMTDLYEVKPGFVPWENLVAKTRELVARKGRA